MRAFIAIELPRSLRTQLTRFAQDAFGSDPAIRCSHPDTLHLTLRFLGELDSARFEAIASALATVANATTAWESSVRGLGAFPSPQRPRVIWTGVNCADEGNVDRQLADLAGRIDAALAELEWPSRDLPWRPHVTLARLRRPSKAGIVLPTIEPEHVFGVFPIHEVVLFESRLEKGAVRHIARSRSALLPPPTSPYGNAPQRDARP